MRKNAGAPVHLALVDRVEANGADPMKQSLAQGDIVYIRRRRPAHPHMDMTRIVHEVAKAGMGL